MTVALGDMDVIGNPPPKLWKALAVIAKELHPAFARETWIEHREKSKGRVSEERVYGSFVRAFNLPSNIDSNKVEADYENGVLHILLPKTAASQAKQIQIREGKAREKAA